MEDLCSKGVRDFASAASIHVSESCGLPTQLSPPSSLQYPTLPTSYVQRCLTSLQGVETWSLDQQCQAVALAFLVSQLLQETQDRGRFDGGNIKPGSDPTERSFPFLSGIPRQKYVISRYILILFLFFQFSSLVFEGYLGPFYRRNLLEAESPSEYSYL